MDISSGVKNTYQGGRKEMELLKQIWASLLLIISLGWVLFHLILIKKYGVVQIKEDNKWILKLEIVLVSLLVLFGIERFIKVIRDGTDNSTN